MPTVVDLPPPDLHDEDIGGNGGSGWVVLIKARHDIDAHLLAGRLSEAGIESRTMRDVSAPGAWMYGGSNPWAPVSILVKRLDLEDAKLVLAEVAYEAPSADRLAEQVAQRRLGTFPILWWVTAVLLGAAVSVLVLSQATRLGATGCQLPAFCEQR